MINSAFIVKFEEIGLWTSSYKAIFLDGSCRKLQNLWVKVSCFCFDMA
jgi:hypothetical protein